MDALPQGELLLALESPERFAIALNGRPVSSDATRGWWVDPSLKLLALDPAWLRLGENRLRLDIAYTEDDGLEIVYLLGDFGVTLAGGQARIVAAPQQLEIGDWTTQGLPFYAGSVCYRRDFAPPRLAKGERLFVRVPGYRGVAARVLVNGKEGRLHRMGAGRGGHHRPRRGRSLRAGHRTPRPPPQFPRAAPLRREVAGDGRPAVAVRHPGQGLVATSGTSSLRADGKPAARSPAALEPASPRRAMSAEGAF